MLITFHKIHHFWENGKNSKWEVAEQFPGEWLDWIKKQYSDLEKSRPAYKERGSTTIFFRYQERQDVYGRSIVEITALYAPVQFIDPELVNGKIANYFTTNSSFIEIDIPEALIRTPLLQERENKNKKYSRLPILGIITALVLLFGFLYMKGVLNQAVENVEKFSVTKVPSKAAQLDFDTEETIKNKKEGRILNNVPAKEKTDRKKTMKAGQIPKTIRSKKMSILTIFCKQFAEELKQTYDYCFRSYANDQCSGNLRKPYLAWKKQSQLGDCNFQDDLNLDEWKKSKMNSTNQNLLNKFFKGL
jgi:hypothetical protein